MQDDCLDVTNKPFYKRQKQLIPPPRGASFRTSKIMLMLTWRLYYGGAVITVCGSSVFRVSLLLLLHYQFPTRSHLVQVGLFYVVNDYLVVPTVSVDFMQPENVMVSQAVQCVASGINFFPPQF